MNVRATSTLWSSWIAIRSKAVHSKNANTREDAKRIDQNPGAVLRGLQEALRRDTFEFSLQRGVLQKRPGKKPRPIVVSPVTNRIVQRAILDTLQSPSPRLRSRLGDIPVVLSTPTSVGGVPGKGGKDAVQLIRRAISEGASFYVRSDIRDFFTKVPTRDLLDDLEQQTGDPRFVQLVREGLAVELNNADDPHVREWLSLFPDGTTGVPQGSSLSAFCANYVLKDFDRQMNGRGIVTVRYIDDFVVLGPSEAAVTKAWSSSERILKGLGLETHQPVKGGSKASMGSVSEGFDFLSFHFNDQHVGISADAKVRLKKEFRSRVGEGKKRIQQRSKVPRRADAMYAQLLVELDRMVRGWGDAFREADNRVEFYQIDKWVSGELRNLHSWYLSVTKGMSDDQKRRAFGVALLCDTPPPDYPDDDEEDS